MHPARPVTLLQDIVYTKLECVGRGGSSKVYKVMAPNRKIFALKRIRLQVGLNATGGQGECPPWMCGSGVNEQAPHGW